jgi:hypothetical protein
MKNKHIIVNEELNKFNQFIESAVAGKIKTIQYYPEEEVNKVKKWIKASQ